MVVASVSGLHQHVSLSLGQLLQSGEIVAIVDDDAAIREPLRFYFAEHGLPVAECASATELMQVMAVRNVALVLLDIGLPDTDGLSLLPQIVDQYPDAAVVMLTGVADLRVALECMRNGGTDYLSKPVQFEEIFYVARKALEKRRLIFENRKYQEELEEAHSRMHLLHQLSVKMNTVYLSTGELDQILRTVLVGITSQEGLGFNRAFLVMFDEDNRFLRGRMAIGPSSREEAGRVWEEIEKRKLDFLQIVDNFKETNTTQDAMVNNIARDLVVSVEDKDNLLICAALCRRSYKVAPENGWVPVLIERRGVDGDKLKTGAMTHRHRVKVEEVAPAVAVPRDLINILDEDYFVVVPLYSPGRSFGVIIADNYVTRRGIEASHISALELFANQASLAIEQSLLHNERQRKIAELEAVNQELDRSKDLLVEAERYSALGHMAAQLVHIIRNPITSIGGVSRILDKKNIDPEWAKYLHVIIHETERVEAILEDLFDFVKQGEIYKEALSLGAVIEKTALLLQTSMVKNGITWEMEGAYPELIIQGDMHQIRQMFIILFKNAIEAMSDGGRLSIILAAAEGQAIVSVIDNGPGMPESYLDKVKDPFFTTKTYGTGMGLTLVGRIVSNHGGSFSLKPHPGGGLEVRVMLPLQ